MTDSAISSTVQWEKDKGSTLIIGSMKRSAYDYDQLTFYTLSNAFDSVHHTKRKMLVYSSCVQCAFTYYL